MCLETLGAHESRHVPRSNTIILAKNIPFMTEPGELRELFARYGELARVNYFQQLLD